MSCSGTLKRSILKRKKNRKREHLRKRRRRFPVENHWGCLQGSAATWPDRASPFTMFGLHGDPRRRLNSALRACATSFLVPNSVCGPFKGATAEFTRGPSSKTLNTQAPSGSREVISWDDHSSVRAARATTCRKAFVGRNAWASARSAAAGPVAASLRRVISNEMRPRRNQLAEGAR